ncbi:MAG: hypothetical protein GWP08_09800 [Nitrospiraceae bacterium]|nr:hypothetical protein [Nitrospiraceae bacterium]
MQKRTRIERCARCGKYVGDLADEKWCANCAAEYQEQVERVENTILNEGLTVLTRIAERTGLTEDTVRHILKDTKSLAQRVEVEFPCARCRQKPAQPGSDYCLNCRMDLDQALGEAAAQLADDVTPEPVDPPASKPVDNVEAAVENKRKRTSITRMYPRRQRFK